MHPEAYCKCMNKDCTNRHYGDVLSDAVKSAPDGTPYTEPLADDFTDDGKLEPLGCQPITAGTGISLSGAPDPINMADPDAPPPRELHPAVLGILRFFDYHHLRPELQAVSRPFHDLAHTMAEKLPADAEVTVGLRKLREAKDVLVSIAALGLPR